MGMPAKVTEHREALTQKVDAPSKVVARGKSENKRKGTTDSLTGRTSPLIPMQPTRLVQSSPTHNTMIVDLPNQHVTSQHVPHSPITQQPVPQIVMPVMPSPVTVPAVLSSARTHAQAMLRTQPSQTLLQPSSSYQMVKQEMPPPKPTGTLSRFQMLETQPSEQPESVVLGKHLLQFMFKTTHILLQCFFKNQLQNHCHQRWSSRSWTQFTAPKTALST